jgi:SnoaL-like domain
MELWELVAREEIRETLVRYNHFGDSGKFIEMAALFASDGVLEVQGERAIEGRDAIIEFLNGVNRDVVALSDVPMLRHYATNVTISVVSEHEATAASAFFVVAETGLDHWGRYRDRLVPADGGWRFAHRSVRTDGYAPDGWAIRRQRSS